MGNGVAEYCPEPGKEDQSVLQYLPLVKGIAYRLAVRMPHRAEMQDLISAGVVGLMQAMRDYDPSRNNRFQTYAYIRIRGAMLDSIREQDWVPRSFRDRYKQFIQVIHDLSNRLGREPEEEEIREALEMTPEEYATFLEKARPLSFLSLDDLPLSRDALEGLARNPYASAVAGPGESAELQEVRQSLGDALDKLPEREKLVIQLYYFNELNLKEIGKVLGVGESRVCQIHTQALMRLKGRLGSQDLHR